MAASRQSPAYTYGAKSLKPPQVVLPEKQYFSTIAPFSAVSYTLDMENTYKVPEQNLNTLQVRIDKLARRCKRAGIVAPLMTIGAHTDTPYRDAEYFECVRRTFAVTISSVERPKIEGYEFLAVLSPVTNDEGTMLGNVLRAVPGASVTPEARFRTASNYCDHCKTERFRLETFVITDGTTQRQIGRNCLANYLGLTDPHRLAMIAEILIDLSDLAGMSENEDGFGGGSGNSPRYLLGTVLEIAASAIRQYGWLSGKSAREFEKPSTSSRVQTWMFGSPEVRKSFEFPLTVSDADSKLADETEEWLATLGEQTDDYMYNLSLLAHASSVVVKNFGIVVSAINAYSRAKEREIRRNARIESDKNSIFVGAPGQRMTFENLVILYTTTWANDFGVTHMYKMKSGEDVIVYFSSRDMGFEQGQVVTKFIATVKKHEIRDGINQTIVTRGKVAPREISKEEKKAISKLRKIQKHVSAHTASDEMAYMLISNLIEEIQQNGFTNLAPQETE